MSRLRKLLPLLGGVMLVSICHPSFLFAAEPEGAPAEPSLHPKVKFETTLGDFVVELDAERAPITVLNFVDYVQDQFYDGTVFHRIKPSYLIQGGGYTRAMDKKSEGLRAAIATEWKDGLKHLRGTIAMARKGGRVHSATCEFFINLVDDPRLDQPQRDGAGYAVFGRVIEGMETIEAIRKTSLGTHPNYAAARLPVVPITPVVIESVRLQTPFSREQVESLVGEREAEIKLAAERQKAAGQRQLRDLILQIEKETGSKMVTTGSGLKYADIRVGLGPPVLPDDTIEMHYRGTLVDGTEFETTLHGEPRTYRITELIDGLAEGIISMKEGGRRKLIVPPELGFGVRGIPGRIPKNATLFYDIDLLTLK